MDVAKKYCCTHCKDIHIDDGIVYALIALEKQFGCDLFVLSAYRCEIHNKDVGGAEQSEHVKGNAIDFTCGTMSKLEEIAEHLSLNWIGGFKYYKNKRFIHIDVGRNRRW